MGWRVRAPVALLAVVFTACSAAAPPRRYVGRPAQEPPRLGIVGNDGRLEVTVEHWIVPNGPGSWVRGARWDEVVLSIRNRSDDTVDIEAIRLVDPRGLYITAGVDPVELESRSEELAQQYEDIGVSVAIFAAPAAITGAALASGSVATAATAVALAPVAVVAAPAYYFWRRHAKLEDREQIESEFKRRQLPALILRSQGSARGSRFFPIVPSPRSLSIDYRSGDDRYSLEIPLEELSGLHIATGKGEDR
jgi:hypothetical protein